MGDPRATFQPRHLLLFAIQVFFFLFFFSFFLFLEKGETLAHTYPKQLSRRPYFQIK